MHFIDSHVHIWTHNLEYPWAMGETDMPSGEANPDALIHLLQKNGVERAVLVQYIKYRWDNRYVAQVMKTCPDLFWGVCRIDPENADGPDRLSYWTEVHGFQGVRLSPESDARGNWFSGPLMVPLFSRAAALNVPVILLIKPDRLCELAQILERVPHVIVLIDHLADCLNRQEPKLNDLLALARYPNVFLKLGHVPQHSSEKFPWRDTYAALEKIVGAFGAMRMMWGSDWPFCLKHMTYAQSLAYVHDEVAFLSPEDRAWMLGKTALRIWH